MLPANPAVADAVDVLTGLRGSMGVRARIRPAMDVAAAHAELDRQIREWKQREVDARKRTAEVVEARVKAEAELRALETRLLFDPQPEELGVAAVVAERRLRELQEEHSTKKRAYERARAEWIAEGEFLDALSSENTRLCRESDARRAAMRRTARELERVARVAAHDAPPVLASAQTLARAPVCRNSPRRDSWIAVPTSWRTRARSSATTRRRAYPIPAPQLTVACGARSPELRECECKFAFRDDRGRMRVLVSTRTGKQKRYFLRCGGERGAAAPLPDVRRGSAVIS